MGRDVVGQIILQLGYDRTLVVIDNGIVKVQAHNSVLKVVMLQLSFVVQIRA